MGPKPLVSVIVPTHNHAVFLDEALTSIHAQTWRPLETIVVDDGSTDDPKAAIAHWLACGVRLLQQPQRGAAEARNRGLEMARGDFIAFLDADDLWPCERMLEVAVDAFSADPDLGWTFGDALPFTASGVDKRFAEPPYLRSGGYYTEPSTQPRRVDLTPADLCNNDRFFIPTGTLVIRKRCFDEIGGFDAGLRMFEDTDMWLRLLRYPVAFFADVLLWRRVHASNVSHRRWAHLGDLRTLFERHDLASHGVSFDFHAARAHYGAGRQAWRQRDFNTASQEFAQALAYRRSWRPRVLRIAATVAARFVS